MKKLFFAIIITGISLAGSTRAVGLSVAPSELAVKGSAGTPFSGRLTVTNTSSGVAVFEVYPDEMQSMITAAPASFVLESGGSKDVEVRMAAADPGSYKTMISVTASPLSASGFRAGAGIKVTFSALAGGAKAGYLASLYDLARSPVFLILLGLLILNIWSILRKRPLS